MIIFTLENKKRQKDLNRANKRNDHNNNIVFGDKFTHDERLMRERIVVMQYPILFCPQFRLHTPYTVTQTVTHVLKLVHKMYINALSHSLGKKS